MTADYTLPGSPAREARLRKACRQLYERGIIASPEPAPDKGQGRRRHMKKRKGEA